MKINEHIRHYIIIIVIIVNIKQSDRTSSVHIVPTFGKKVKNKKIKVKKITNVKKNRSNNNKKCTDDISYIPYSSDIPIQMQIILRRVAEIVANNTKSSKRCFLTGKIYNQLYFRNDITSSDELMRRLHSISRKSHKNLEKLYTFCNIVDDYIADDESIEEVAIATTGGLRWMFSVSGAAEVIELAKKVDLLVCTDPYYKPSTKGKKDGTARKYIINPRMRKIIIKAYLDEQTPEIRKKNGHSGRGRAGKRKTKEEDKMVVDPEKQSDIQSRYNIRFSSNLHLPASITDAEAESAIRARYPFFSKMEKLVAITNEKYYSQCNTTILRLGIKITRGDKGVISKIGTRLYSRLCSLRNNNIPEDYEGITRPQFLDTYYGGRKYYEYDVKSSIYRVAYLLKTGEWLDNTVDLYALMSPYPFRDTGDRDNYKRGLAMLLYFGGSPKKIVENLRFKHDEVKMMGKQGIKKEDLEQAIDLAQRKMFSVVGESLGSEIMYHESAIYLLMLLFLLNCNVNVVSVYDEFISDDSSLSTLCNEFLPKIAGYYKSTCDSPSSLCYTSEDNL